MSKKLLSILLAVLMVISLVPVSAMAATTQEVDTSQAIVNSWLELEAAVKTASVTKIVISPLEIQLEEALEIDRDIAFETLGNDTTLYAAEGYSHMVVNHGERDVAISFNQITLSGMGSDETTFENTQGGVYSGETDNDTPAGQLSISGAIIENCAYGIYGNNLSLSQVSVNSCVVAMQSNGEVLGISDCSFDENSTGVSINESQTEVTVQNSHFSKNGSYGLFLDEIASAHIEDSSFTQNNGIGLKAFDIQESLQIANSDFLNNEEDGINVQYHSSQFSIEECTVSENATGIQMGTLQGGSVTITDCEISKNKLARGGIYASGTIDTLYIGGTQISENYGGAALSVSITSDVTIENCAILSNEWSSMNVNGNASGGGLYLNTSGTPVNIMNTDISNNLASYGGGIYAGNSINIVDSRITGNSAWQGAGIYAKYVDRIISDETTLFRGNNANGGAYYSPENASSLYPNIQFSGTSIGAHPLNNYDINYVKVGGNYPYINYIRNPKSVAVSFGTTAPELQAKLSSNRPTVKAYISTGTIVDLPVIWNVEESDFDATVSGAIYTVSGRFDISDHTDISDPGFYPIYISVNVGTPLAEPNKWLRSENMEEERYANQVLEIDGKLYVSGTKNSSGYSDPNYFLVYDIASNEWSETESSYYSYSNYFVYNKVIYALGNRKISIYDPKNDYWGEVGTADLGYDYTSPKGVIYDDGRSDGNGNPPENTYVYNSSTAAKAIPMRILDMNTSTWRNGAEMPIGLETSGEPIIYDDKIITLCRSSVNQPQGNIYDQVLIYDISEDTWYQRGAPDSFYRETRILYEDKIYFLGGFDENFAIKNTVDIYDISNNVWSKSIEMPRTSHGHTSILVDSRIYVIGGYSTSNYAAHEKTCMIYDIDTDSWSIGGELSIARTNFAAVEHIDKLYVVGTNTTVTGSDNRKSMEIYETSPVIQSYEKLPDIVVAYEMSADDLQNLLVGEYPAVEVDLSDGTTEILSINWDIENSDYDGTASGTYTIYGKVDLTGRSDRPIPWGYTAEIEVEVRDPIVSIDNKYITVDQNIPLAPVESDHTFGVPNSADAPSTVTAHLESGATIELPVNWNRESLDSSVTGVQTVFGEVMIEDGLGVSNQNNVKPQLIITVLPTQYEVWLIEETGERSLEVLPGATLAEIECQLRDEGIGTADVIAYNIETDQCAYLYANLLLSEDDNSSFTPDVPGNYILTASLAENFIADYIDAIIINVTVLPPLEIVEVETAYIDAYQSFAVENIDNVPEQVNVTLENDMVIPVEVDWNWSGYNRDIAGQQFITGTLKNIPSKAVNSAGCTAMLVVDVEAVDYEVIEVLSDNCFVFDAGFTLAEITQALEPTINLEIQSTGREENFTTEYEVEIVLSDEENTDYAYDYADLYILKGDLQLPGNISYDDTYGYDEIFIETIPVEVVSIEPVYLTANDGTYFEDIPGLVNGVSVTLSNGKNIVINVAWNGSLYQVRPTGLTEENPVEQFIPGELVDYPQYVNITLIEAELTVTTVMVYYLDSISPARFPDTGVIDVDLGSSVEDIYNGLTTHTVELSLSNSSGSVTKTVDVTFELREQDNEDYDSTTLGTYTLRAYLPLAGNILNPNNLGVEIFVETTKYTISSTSAVRLTGVTVGTPFDEIGLPEKASATLTGGRVVELDTNWNSDGYQPNKIGSQVVRGSFATPYPLYVENPNNRQPNAMVTIVNPQVTVISMEQIIEVAPMSRTLFGTSTSNEIEGFIEYKYRVELLHEDGTVTNDIISIFVETE